MNDVGGKMLLPDGVTDGFFPVTPSFRDGRTSPLRTVAASVGGWGRLEIVTLCAVPGQEFYAPLECEFRVQTLDRQGLNLAPVLRGLGADIGFGIRVHHQPEFSEKPALGDAAQQRVARTRAEKCVPTCLHMQERR